MTLSPDRDFLETKFTMTHADGESQEADLAARVESLSPSPERIHDASCYKKLLCGAKVQLSWERSPSDAVTQYKRRRRPALAPCPCLFTVKPLAKIPGASQLGYPIVETPVY